MAFQTFSAGGLWKMTQKLNDVFKLAGHLLE